MYVAVRISPAHLPNLLSKSERIIFTDYLISVFID